MSGDLSDDSFRADMLAQEGIIPGFIPSDLDVIYAVDAWLQEGERKFPIPGVVRHDTKEAFLEGRAVPDQPNFYYLPPFTLSLLLAPKSFFAAECCGNRLREIVDAGESPSELAAGIRASIHKYLPDDEAREMDAILSSYEKRYAKLFAEYAADAAVANRYPLHLVDAHPWATRNTIIGISSGAPLCDGAVWVTKLEYETPLVARLLETISMPLLQHVLEAENAESEVEFLVSHGYAERLTASEIASLRRDGA